MEPGRAAHFVAGNEVFYGHNHCVLQKTRFTICHPQFVGQFEHTKGEYVSVGVQNKRRRKNLIRIWGNKNVTWMH